VTKIITKRREDSLLGQIANIQRQVSALTLVCSGTLLCRMKVCGKPTCRCAHDPAARHGPYHEWSRLVDGRLVHSVVTPQQAKLLRLAILNRRRILRLLRKWEAKSIQLINVQIDR
jgi:hypothetical protein